MPPNASSSWDIIPLLGANENASSAVQLRLRGSSPGGLCLSSAGPVVPPTEDPWCVANNNMWRSATDTLQQWPRVMVEVESVAAQGGVSRPGAWSFPDCLELGVPGEGVLTWEESKANLALFAVTSAPLLLGNDARAGRMQPRLVALLTNPDMLAVNAAYDAEAAFAGGRMWTKPGGRELWAKPLGAGAAAAVLFNRGGATTPCNIPADQPQLAPCDDDPARAHGAQRVALAFGTDFPRGWLLPDVGDDELVECDVFDIFATPDAGQGAPLGRFQGGWAAVVPPHGVRFVRVGNCTAG